MAHLQTFAQGELKHLLGARRKRNVTGHGLGAVADELLNLAAHVLEVDAHGLQRLGRDTLALLDQAEQDVLRAHVIVVQRARFLLRQDDNAAGSVGKPLEHQATP